MSSESIDKESLKKLLLEYQDYEVALLDKELENGAPQSIDGHRFSFTRFFNWLFELEQL